MSFSADPHTQVFVYGPVPSRRLGHSLGVDILPFKTCSFDCIYCQLGRTPKKVLRRKSYFSREKILEQIKAAVDSGRPIDYITFSGSGEPTLNLEIGPLIQAIKATWDIPVAVLTNSSLFRQKTVRRALHQADLIVPSLDAPDEKTFQMINRPHRALNFRQVWAGMVEFSQEYQGRLWLEIMLLKGINDSPGQIRKFSALIGQLEPDKVQINTAVRPPAEEFAQPLSHEEMQKIRSILGPPAEIIAETKARSFSGEGKTLDQKILALVQRRPVTLEDMCLSLGLSPHEILKRLARLEKQGRISSSHHGSQRFFKAKI